MGFLTSIWNGLVDGLGSILSLYESLLLPLSGDFALGFAIILLTVTVRIFLIPLMVRQTKSMRAMQQLQPELKRIKEKYKADRSMMKTDPERYKKLKEKEREAQMALYQEHQVNPVGGCLPLLLQMPIFFALFTLLRDNSRVEHLDTASFFGIDSLSNTAADGAGFGAVALVILQALTTYYTQKQMQSRNTTAAPEQAQVMKLMLYIMPVFLAYLSFTFPVGVVLYWVTTNVWTIGQQHFIFKQAEAAEAQAAEERAEARKAKKAGKGQGGNGPGRSPSGRDDQSAELTEGTSSGTNGTGRKKGQQKGPQKGANGRSSQAGRKEAAARKAAADRKKGGSDSPADDPNAR
jgi:YidC/Oxa1 family membrane protein insertase